ncbi:histidine phosphatase family protein [Sinorhizobium sp. BG8]|uniref:SixA phosphatase family protein n=1 Tax=Sinorhizobium sp. BG8 TaxID=2613773 RepID=UPI00193E00BD|nr:histidine phosphatase family protein [Sinorhizobium sp. BG8]QRM55659.1 histidine phosphatase family protein [Sinorhizobium sp. BG8]
MTTQDPPAFRLYLLRHARAAWALPGQTDFDRALDEQGYAEAEIIAEELADQGYAPEIVVSSTAVRCRETAEPLRRTLGEELEIQYIDSLYAATADTYEEIAFAPRPQASLMLVGHNPTMEEFFRQLVGQAIAEAAAPSGFPTAGLAVLDFDARPDGNILSGGRLAGFLAPRLSV